MDNTTDKKILFPIKVEEDNMLVVIPRNTKLAPELEKLSFDDFVSYFFSLGFKLKPKADTYKKFIQLFSNKAVFLEEDFPVLLGRSFMPPRDTIIKWLNDPHKSPLDLVQAGVPFAMLYPARGPLPARDVFGQDAELPSGAGENKALTPFKLHPDLTVSDNGEVTSNIAGQAILKPNFLDFLPAYTILDVRLDIFKNIVFPCDVVVKCDLEGALEWVVEGDLTVEGFWSAQHIKVKKNAHAKTGIQTNFIADEKNSLHIEGSLEARFIQNSTLTVGGKVTVASAIINSHLVIEGGDLECRGDPGKIIGSEILLKTGSVFAKSTGSEKNKVTFLHFFTAEGSDQSKIDSVIEGTRMQIKKAKMIIPTNQPWPPLKK